MRRVAVIVLIWVSLSTLLPVHAAQTVSSRPGARTIERACGMSYFGTMRRVLSRMFSEDDAANFSASLTDARQIIIVSEDCANRLPPCPSQQVDCVQGTLSVNAATLLGEQYNVRALMGIKDAAFIAALGSEVDQALFLCGQVGLLAPDSAASEARDTLTLALKSFAALQQRYSDTPMDLYKEELSLCAQRLSLNLSF